MKHLVEIQNLRFSWQKSEGKNLIDIDSFYVKQGEKVFLHGPSGSGKSTFLNLISGVLEPDAGQVNVLDQNLQMLSPTQRDQFRGDHMGFIFQLFNLLPYYSAYENMCLPLRFSKLKQRRWTSETELRKEAERLCARLNLHVSLLDRKVTELSVGQQQRVAAARALIGRPDLIIADEPTSALDADARKGFLDLLFTECQDHQIGLIFVSHDLELGSVFDRSISLASLNNKTALVGENHV